MLAFLLVGCIDYSFNEPVEEFEEPIPVDTGEETYYDPTPVADAPVYANTSDTLYEIDPVTGKADIIANFWDADGSIRNFVDIAIDLKGRMYGGTYDSLYRIDPTSGEATFICMPPAEMTALAFTSDGVLVAGGSDRISTVDVETCEIEVLLAGAYWQTSGDLVGLPDGYLYWTVVGDGMNGDELVKLDPNTGMTQWVGATGQNGLYGLGYDNDQLFGFSVEGKVVAIDPKTASGQLRGKVPNVSWWGATTNPVIW